MVIKKALLFILVLLISSVSLTAQELNEFPGKGQEQREWLGRFIIFRQLADSYKKVAQHPANIKTQIHQLGMDLAAFYSRKKGHLQHSELTARARKLIKYAKADPAAASIIGHCLICHPQAINLKEAHIAFRLAMTASKNKSLYNKHFGSVSPTVILLIQNCRNSLFVKDEELISVLRQRGELLNRFICSAYGKTPEYQLWTLNIMRQQKKYRPVQKAMYEGFLKKKKKLPEWIRHMATADYHNILAWEARGGEYASKVKNSAWPIFKEKLQLQEAALLLAIKSVPQMREPYSDLILNLLYQGKDYLPAFLQAYEIDPAYQQTHTALQNAKLPRWGGSIKELLDLCHEYCSAAKPLDQAYAGLTYLEALKKELKDKQAYRKCGAYKLEIDLRHRIYLAFKEKGVLFSRDASGPLSRYFGTVMYYKDYQSAVVFLKDYEEGKLNSAIMQSYHINAKRTVSFLHGYKGAASKQFIELYEKMVSRPYEQMQNNSNFNRHMQQLIQQAEKLSKNSQAKYFLECCKKICSLQEQYLKGEKVSLPIDKDLSTWRTHSGYFEEKNKELHGISRHGKHIALECLAFFPGNIHVEATIEHKVSSHLMPYMKPCGIGVGSLYGKAKGTHYLIDPKYCRIFRTLPSSRYKAYNMTKLEELEASSKVIVDLYDLSENCFFKVHGEAQERILAPSPGSNRGLLTLGLPSSLKWRSSGHLVYSNIKVKKISPMATLNNNPSHKKQYEFFKNLHKQSPSQATYVELINAAALLEKWDEVLLLCKIHLPRSVYTAKVMHPYLMALSARNETGKGIPFALKAVENRRGSPRECYRLWIRLLHLYGQKKQPQWNQDLSKRALLLALKSCANIPSTMSDCVICARAASSLGKHKQSARLYRQAIGKSQSAEEKKALAGFAEKEEKI